MVYTRTRYFEFLLLTEQSKKTFKRSLISPQLAPLLKCSTAQLLICLTVQLLILLNIKLFYNNL